MKHKPNSVTLLLIFLFSGIVNAEEFDIRMSGSNKIGQSAELMLAEDESGRSSGTQLNNEVKRSPSFVEMDVNNDNYVTPDELKAYPILTQDFEKADAGKDGRLDQHEYLNLLREKTTNKYLEKQ